MLADACRVHVADHTRSDASNASGVAIGTCDRRQASPGSSRAVSMTKAKAGMLAESCRVHATCQGGRGRELGGGGELGRALQRSAVVI